jgi:hypothetical protein
MIKSLIPLAATVLLSTGVANAGSSNQAVTVCKSHLKENVEGFKRAKLGKVRNLRDSHVISFVVSSDAGSSSTKCVVNKEDGSIALQN